MLDTVTAQRKGAAVEAADSVRQADRHGAALSVQYLTLGQVNMLVVW